MRTIAMTRVKKATILLMLAVLTVGLGYGFADDALAAEKFAALDRISSALPINSWNQGINRQMLFDFP